jgi:hypothetical protein
MENERMKPWFAIRDGEDHGPYSRLLGFSAKPLVWQGWLLTVVYYAVHAGIGYFHLPYLRTEALALGSMLFGMLLWHFVVMRLVARRYAPAG